MGTTLRAAVWLSVWLGVAGAFSSSSVLAAAILVGPPTFQSTSHIEEDRGGVDSLVTLEQSDRRWGGQGGATFAHVVLGADLLKADGTATNLGLKSLSRVSGGLLGATSPPALPHVLATNRSEVTRFFEFSSSTLPTVPVDFIAFLDGLISTTIVFESLPTAFAGVTFGLEVVDPSNAVLTSIFEVSAAGEFDPGNPSASLFGWKLVTAASGTAALSDWDAAIVDISPGDRPSPSSGVCSRSTTRRTFRAPITRRSIPPSASTGIWRPRRSWKASWFSIRSSRRISSTPPLWIRC